MISACRNCEYAVDRLILAHFEGRIAPTAKDNLNFEFLLDDELWRKYDAYATCKLKAREQKAGNGR